MMQCCSVLPLVFYFLREWGWVQKSWCGSQNATEDDLIEKYSLPATISPTTSPRTYVVKESCIYFYTGWGPHALGIWKSIGVSLVSVFTYHSCDFRRAFNTSGSQWSCVLFT
jgi:hypothetical protein